MNTKEYLDLVRQGDIQELEKLKAGGFDLTTSNKQGVNGWHAAVKAGKMLVAEWFWNHGINSVYAEPWVILSTEKNLDFYIKFDGHKRLNTDQLIRAIMCQEYKFVKWAMMKSLLSDGQKQACFANALRYCTTGYYLGSKYDLLPFDMVELCMNTLPDITENDNLLMKDTWSVKDKLQPKVVDYIMNNQRLIDMAIKLGQYELLPKTINDVFIF